MPAADGEFVSLAQLLRPAPASTEVAPQPLAVCATAAAEPLPLPDVAEVARDVRLFRARLHDAFDSACDALLREFAYAVLGRELVLAPPDIAAIAARIIKEHRAAQPLRMRVAPSDVSLLVQCANELPPLTCDPELSPGDAILELAGGAIDARLGVRLAALLEKQS